MTDGLTVAMDVSGQRLRGLDALRGLVALGVVLYHYATIYDVQFGPYPSRPLFFVSDGHFGVELFFCLSGFVILGTLERSGSLRRFAVARFARLYPAYFVCTLISLAVLQMTSLPFPEVSARDIAVNFTMLASLNGTELIDPSYWTLSYEVIFYAGAGLVWAYLGGRRYLEWFCLAWLACAVAGHWLPWFGLHHRLTVIVDVPYANLFVIGMMLYCLSQGTRTRLTIPTLGAALLLTGFPPEQNRGHLPQPAYVAMIVAFAALIWLIARTGGRLLDFKPLVFLGGISYSLYLIHQVAGFAVIHALLRFGAETNAVILLTTCLMVGVAFGLRTFVEQPAERWIKGLARPQAPEKAPSASAAATGR